MKKVKYPTTIKKDSTKLEFLYNAQEALKVQHNAKGLDFTNGIISKQEWEDYRKNDFKVKDEHIGNGIMEMRENMLKSNKHSINLSTLIEDVNAS